MIVIIDHIPTITNRILFVYRCKDGWRTSGDKTEEEIKKGILTFPDIEHAKAFLIKYNDGIDTDTPTYMDWEEFLLLLAERKLGE